MGCSTLHEMRPSTTAFQLHSQLSHEQLEASTKSILKALSEEELKQLTVKALLTALGATGHGMSAPVCACVSERGRGSPVKRLF